MNTYRLSFGCSVSFCSYIWFKLLSLSPQTTIYQIWRAWSLSVYPINGANLTLIQPTRSAYPYPLVILILYPYHLRRCYRLLWTLHCPRSRYCDVTSYGRYCSTEYARTWAGHLSTPSQREFSAITGCQSIDNLLDFNAICCIFLSTNSIYIIVTQL